MSIITTDKATPYVRPVYVFVGLLEIPMNIGIVSSEQHKEVAMENCKLTLDQVNGIRFSTDKVAKEPISDFRVVAGLLFRRWNDATQRWISYRAGERVSILHIQTEHSDAQFEVLATCVEKLDELAMFYDDLDEVCEVRLSQSGERTVVHDWFGNSASVLDKIATTVPERY